MNRYTLTIALLSASNIFMTFAWYGHLKSLSHKPWIIAALVSWGIALLEYLLQVPANRIGHDVMSVGQLKILQEVITLSIFVPFSVLYLKEKLTLDYLWAGLCLLGAVFSSFARRSWGLDTYPFHPHRRFRHADHPPRFILDLPDWAPAELLHVPEYLPRLEDRMAAVLRFARLNTEHQSGGPFSAGVLSAIPAS
jgi:Uncharacterized protein conserved in bacteria